MLPKQNPEFTGHEAAIGRFSRAVASGKIHHAWLLSGPQGIGKATFAYRIARYILSGGLKKEQSANLFGEPEINMDMPENHPVFSQIAGGSNPDLMVLETDGESSEIKIDEIRKINGMMRKTSASSGYKIVIIDSADEMNWNAANALLKILEEPPQNSFLFLISHIPGKLLPTIRSRCMNLEIRPLGEDSMRQVLSNILPDPQKDEVEFAIKVAGGSPGLAYKIYQSSGFDIYNQLIKIFSSAPNINIADSLTLSNEAAAKTNPAKWEIYNYLLNFLVSRAIKASATSENLSEAMQGEHNILQIISEKNLDYLLELHAKLQQLKHDAEILNLDKKSSVINQLNMLANGGV